MKKLLIGGLAIAAVLLTAFFFPQNTSSPQPEAGIEWLRFPEVEQVAKKKKKKIYVDVYTDWCGWCKVMDKKTFTDQAVIDYMDKKYHAVKLNAERRDSVIFKGQTFKFIASGRRGYHQLAAALVNGRLSYPTSVILNEKFQILQIIPGYQKPDQLLKILQYYGEDEHLSKAKESSEQQ